MQQQPGREEAQQTGTRNETYDVIAVLYHALQGAENCQIYAQDAKDGPTREFFQQALQMQRQLADQGKQVLQQVLQNDTGGSSAFGWGSSSGQSFSQGQSQFETQGSSGSGGSSGGSGSF